jgi:prophage regulatory protein
MTLKPMYLDLPRTAEFLALSVRTWQNLVQAGQAPKPRKLSGGRVGWLVSELEAWAESRPVSDLPPPVNAGKRRGRPPKAPAPSEA